MKNEIGVGHDLQESNQELVDRRLYKKVLESDFRKNVFGKSFLESRFWKVVFGKLV